MRDAAKEAFKKNLHHYKTMKTIPQAYFSKREFSVQEADYHNLP